MSRTVSRLVGYALWHGSKWYLRHHLRRARRFARATVAVVLTLSVVALILRRRLAS